MIKEQRDPRTVRSEDRAAMNPRRKAIGRVGGEAVNAAAGSPFTRSALALFGAGWSPIPLPPLEKWPPQKGFTGYDAGDVTEADVRRWLASDAGQNIAVVLPRMVLGVDVDEYGDKHGAETLAKAEADHGELPTTVRITSRGVDNPSGIRLYLLPRKYRGQRWADQIGDDVELIHRGHRYALAPGSTHPERRTYQAYDDRAGGAGVELPDIPPGSLPPLPLAWCEAFSRGAPDTRRGSVTYNLADLLDVAVEPDADPCPAMREKLSELGSNLGEGHHHGPARAATMSLVRLAEQGHHGISSALAEADDMLTSSRNRAGSKHNDGGVPVMAAGAADKVLAGDRTADEDRGCCGANSAGWTDVPEGFAGIELVEDDDITDDGRTDGLVLVGDNPKVWAPAEVEELWELRPMFAQLRQWARVSGANPWTVLGPWFGRLACSVPPHVVTNTGNGGSLNLIIALAAASGGGKGEATNAAAAALNAVNGMPFHETNLGTGEGVLAGFGHWNEKLPGNDKSVRVRDSVLLDVREVRTLSVLLGREHATLDGVLLSAWSGERLGFPNKRDRFTLEPGTYRYVVVIGVQPGNNADPLLRSTDTGLAQRVLWLPGGARVSDLLQPGDVPEIPDVISVTLPGKAEAPVVETAEDGTLTRTPTLAGFDVRPYRMPVARAVEDARRRRRIEQVRAGRPDEGHAAFTRFKLAHYLALADGRSDVRAEDDHPAGLIMQVSEATRKTLQKVKRQGDQKRINDQAGMLAVGNVHGDEVEHRALRHRVAEKVRALVRAAGGDPVSKSELRRSLSDRQKEVLDGVLADLVAGGEIEHRKGRNDGDVYVWIG